MTYEELANMVFEEVDEADLYQEEVETDLQQVNTRHDCGYCMYCLQVSW